MQQEEKKTAKITANIPVLLYAKLKAKLAMQNKKVKEWILEKVKEEVGEA